MVKLPGWVFRRAQYPGHRDKRAAAIAAYRTILGGRASPGSLPTSKLTCAYHAAVYGIRKRTDHLVRDGDQTAGDIGVALTDTAVVKFPAEKES